MLKLINQLFFRKPKNLIERYGANSWVLVTGASDGIGKAFCEEFARIGLNVILVARNQQKLQNVEQQLKKINSIVQTKIIIYDFSTTTSHASINYIVDQVKNLDISLLINNVASFELWQEFTKISEKNMEEILNINCSSPLYLTRKLLPFMLKRQRYSAVITVSSQAALKPNPYLQLYSASKIFNNYLSKALSYEYQQNKIDFQLLTIGIVRTNMSKLSVDILKTPDSFQISPQECVRSCLRDLGYENETYGHWKHQLAVFITLIMPYSTFYSINKSMKNQIQDYLNKQGSNSDKKKE